MGEPVQLVCRICGDSYYLHPTNDRPVKDADLCPTCETFQLGMAAFYENRKEKADPVLGWLILGLCGITVLSLLVWAVINYSMR